MSSSIGRTPITCLQEFCAKKKFSQPVYECFEENKTFYCRVQVVNMDVDFAEGIGRSKQEAKHDAAGNLIKRIKLHHPEIEETINVNNTHQSIPTKDAVAILRDICLEQDHPFPQFEMVQQAGPPEAPEFTFQCEIAAVKRYGRASTKKAAKQKAAQEILDIMKNFRPDNSRKELAVVEDVIKSENEANQRKIKTYREYIESDVKQPPPGTFLKDRHSYFTKIEPDLLQQAKKILNDEYVSEYEKIDEVLKALKFKYRKDIMPTVKAQQLVFIELLLPDYDCCFCGSEPEIYIDMIKHFRDVFY